MSKTERNWNDKFLEYMEMIVNHPNYKGLPIKRDKKGNLKWIAPAKSDIGLARIEWAKNKAKQLNISTGPGMYAKVMRAIHPTKMKVCQICGREMSIFYYYPSSNLIKLIKRKFGVIVDKLTHIYKIWDILCNNLDEHNVKVFFIKTFDLDSSYNDKTKTEILDRCEYLCREEGRKYLSPGAMSNFPDRFDGFHTYNICCRSSQDKGRSKENLKSYTKDRRAYEYWSDGNVHAANQFMGSTYFKGSSADHIGPISLGFVHDPRYLVKMTTSDNSTKRDRLTLLDISNIINRYESTKIYPMSWFGRIIWEYILKNYNNHQNLIETDYRKMLKQNMYNFMYCLGYVIDKAGEKGKLFLKNNYIDTKKEYFTKSYSFDEQGNIISCQDRHFTDRNKDEFIRYERIAFDSISEYLSKENRHLHFTGSEKIKKMLDKLCSDILLNKANKYLKSKFEEIIFILQNELINKE